MLPRLVLSALVAAVSVVAAPPPNNAIPQLDWAHVDLWSLPLEALHARDYVPERLVARAEPTSLTVTCFNVSSCQGKPVSTASFSNTPKYNTQILLTTGPNDSFGSCRFDSTGDYRAFVQLQGANTKKNRKGIFAAPISAIGTTPPSGSYCLNQDSLSPDRTRPDGRVVVIGRLGP
ncbi:hypothetical protein Q8F55_003890 [Vanrija albida]|uniref:Uncharacterized protein n=1 Tax=Vanrija albida TaxID=181172 RepID=A0ABR3Q600_9TREE